MCALGTGGKTVALPISSALANCGGRCGTIWQRPKRINALYFSKPCSCEGRSPVPPLGPGSVDKIQESRRIERFGWKADLPHSSPSKDGEGDRAKRGGGEWGTTSVFPSPPLASRAVLLPTLSAGRNHRRLLPISCHLCPSTRTCPRGPPSVLIRHQPRATAPRHKSGRTNR